MLRKTDERNEVREIYPEKIVTLPAPVL